MHLLENYALTAGVKISRPFIDPSYYPIETCRYITFHNGSGMNSKNYDYFSNVFKLIKPFLIDNNIKIVQIGLEEEMKLKNTIDLRGKTTIRQCAYIIKNSMLHIGNDSFSTHIASFLGVPIVCLYGPVLVDTCKPYWGDKSKQVLLSPDYSNRSPSFSASERDKRVNEIFPDKVSSACLDLLNIKHSLNETSPIHLGAFFNLSIIDIVPDFKPDQSLNIAPRSLINLRLDYTDNPNWTKYWLKNYNCTIFSNKHIDINLLSEFRSKISKIYLTVNKDTKPEYIQSILSSGVKLKLLAKDDEQISNIRLNLFPTNVFPEDNLSEKDLDNQDILCDNTCYYESALSIIKDNKIYSSKAALDKGIEKHEKEKIINDPTFFEEINYFKIFKHD